MESFSGSVSWFLRTRNTHIRTISGIDECSVEHLQQEVIHGMDLSGGSSDGDKFEPGGWWKKRSEWVGSDVSILILGRTMGLVDLCEKLGVK